MKFKIGDKVNCNRDEPGWAEWKNATVVEVDGNEIDLQWRGITCICDAYPGEKGLFWEEELDLIVPEE